MSVQIKGSGVAWGITTANSGYTYSGAGTAWKLNTTDQDVERMADTEEFRDAANGDVIGMAVYNRRKQLRLRVYPTDTTLSGAASGATTLPNIGDKFVVTDASDGIAAGTYIITAVSRNRKNTSYATFDVTVVVFTNDISADINS
jgi:hypothetical protein